MIKQRRHIYICASLEGRNNIKTFWGAEGSAPWCGASCLLGSGRVGSGFCGGAPCGRGLGARPCLCLIGAVGLSLCVCVCVCVSVCLRVSLGIYGGGWVGMLYIIVVFSLCEALCVAFKV